MHWQLVKAEYLYTVWANILVITGLTISMIVNAAVMTLIVFRIFKVFLEVRATSDKRILGATARNTLRRIIFVLIESGMVLFSIQLIRLVAMIVSTWTGLLNFLYTDSFIAAIQTMLNVGIKSTVFDFYFADNVG